MSRSGCWHRVAALLLLLTGCGPSESPPEPIQPPAPVPIIPAGAVARQGPPALPSPVFPPGLHTETLRGDDTPPIRYVISVPEGYTPEAGVPLILALHYGGEVTPFYGKDLIEVLVGPAFKELGAIIIAPDSLGGEWNTPENEKAVMILLESVAKNYAVDRKKVAVTGFSMGGNGTWFLAGRHPDQFTAAIPVAGDPSGMSKEWRTPVFAVHGQSDEVQPLGPTKERIEELKSRGIDTELVILDGVTHYQTGRYVSGLTQAVPWLKRVWK